MLKVTGLDKLKNSFDEVGLALDVLNGDLGEVQFTPNDPASIELAIKEVERIIDEKLGNYTNNTIIFSIMQKMKNTYREKIIESAAMARLEQE